MALTKEELYERKMEYKNKPENKLKRIEYDRKRMSDPEYKERMRLKRQTPEHKEKMKVLTKKYRQTEKYKEYKKQYRNSQKAKDARRNQLLLKNFNITLEKYNEMLLQQNSVCAICLKHDEKEVRSLAVDHCHKTGKIRGLLCRYCNQALGILDDDIERMKRAVEYLSK